MADLNLDACPVCGMPADPPPPSPVATAYGVLVDWQRLADDSEQQARTYDAEAAELHASGRYVQRDIWRRRAASLRFVASRARDQLAAAPPPPPGTARARS